SRRRPLEPEAIAHGLMAGATLGGAARIVPVPEVRARVRLPSVLERDGVVGRTAVFAGTDVVLIAAHAVCATAAAPAALPAAIEARALEPPEIAARMIALVAARRVVRRPAFHVARVRLAVEPPRGDQAGFFGVFRCLRHIFVVEIRGFALA